MRVIRPPGEPDRYVTRTCACGAVFEEDWSALERSKATDHSRATGHSEFRVSPATGITERLYTGPTGIAVLDSGRRR